MGILCEPLCAEKEIHSLACETLHAGKEAVFSAHWEATRLVFKSSRYVLHTSTSSLHCHCVFSLHFFFSTRDKTTEKNMLRYP